MEDEDPVDPAPPPDAQEDLGACPNSHGQSTEEPVSATSGAQSTHSSAAVSHRPKRKAAQEALNLIRIIAQDGKRPRGRQASQPRPLQQALSSQQDMRDEPAEVARDIGITPAGTRDSVPTQPLPQPRRRRAQQQSRRHARKRTPRRGWRKGVAESTVSDTRPVSPTAETAPTERRLHSAHKKWEKPEEQQLFESFYSLRNPMHPTTAERRSMTTTFGRSFPALFARLRKLIRDRRIFLQGDTYVYSSQPSLPPPSPSHNSEASS